MSLRTFVALLARSRGLVLLSRSMMARFGSLHPHVWWYIAYGALNSEDCAVLFDGFVRSSGDARPSEDRWFIWGLL